MASQELTEKVKQTIDHVATICKHVEEGQTVEITDIESRVDELSREFNSLNLASEDQVKGDLIALSTMLETLWRCMGSLQEKLMSQMDEITVHQHALQAYSRVANSNFDMH